MFTPFNGSLLLPASAGKRHLALLFVSWYLLKVLDKLAGDILVNNKKFHMNAKNVLDYHSTFRL